MAYRDLVELSQELIPTLQGDAEAPERLTHALPDIERLIEHLHGRGYAASEDADVLKRLSQLHGGLSLLAEELTDAGDEPDEALRVAIEALSPIVATTRGPFGPGQAEAGPLFNPALFSDLLDEDPARAAARARRELLADPTSLSAQAALLAALLTGPPEGYEEAERLAERLATTLPLQKLHGQWAVALALRGKPKRAIARALEGLYLPHALAHEHLALLDWTPADTAPRLDADERALIEQLGYTLARRTPALLSAADLSEPLSHLIEGLTSPWPEHALERLDERLADHEAHTAEELAAIAIGISRHTRWSGDPAEAAATLDEAPLDALPAATPRERAAIARDSALLTTTHATLTGLGHTIVLTRTATTLRYGIPRHDHTLTTEAALTDLTTEDTPTRFLQAIDQWIAHGLTLTTTGDPTTQAPLTALADDDDPPTTDLFALDTLDPDTLD